MVRSNFVLSAGSITKVIFLAVSVSTKGTNINSNAGLFVNRIKIDNSDGRVVRSSASGAEDCGLIPRRVKPIIFKLILRASLLDAQH